MNLGGGSSGFYTKVFSLRELTMTGSQHSIRLLLASSLAFIRLYAYAEFNRLESRRPRQLRT